MSIYNTYIHIHYRIPKLFEKQKRSFFFRFVLSLTLPTHNSLHPNCILYLCHCVGIAENMFFILLHLNAKIFEDLFKYLGGLKSL